MDILGGIIKHLHNFNVDNIFKQSMNAIQRQLVIHTSTHSKKTVEYKDSSLDQISVDQIVIYQDDELKTENEMLGMRLRDQITINQVSVNRTEIQFNESNKQKRKTEMNESCIHIGNNGKLIIRDPSKTDHRNKIIHKISDNKNKVKESISFSGGGYNCVYHLGVVKYIFENPELFQDIKYLGASGGAGIASIALCYESEPQKLMIIDDIIKDIISMRSMNLKLSEQVEKYSSILERYIDEDKFNKYIKRRSRCYISVTDVSDIIPKNVIMNNFESYKQYMESLKASACIPLLLDDTIRTVDGKWCLDGGLSNNIPVINDQTLKISCLNYPLMRADIYPKVICELKYSFISPEEKYIMNMFNLGYNDMEQYMKEYKQNTEQSKKISDVDQCIKCLIEDPLFVN